MRLPRVYRNCEDSGGACSELLVGLCMQWICFVLYLRYDDPYDWPRNPLIGPSPGLYYAVLEENKFALLQIRVVVYQYTSASIRHASGMMVLYNNFYLNLYFSSLEATLLFRVFFVQEIKVQCASITPMDRSTPADPGTWLSICVGHDVATPHISWFWGLKLLILFTK